MLTRIRHKTKIVTKIIKYSMNKIYDRMQEI